MTSRKKDNTNTFANIIAARQQDTPQEPIATEAPSLEPAAIVKNGKNAKRGNPDYSAVTVYLRTENYARAQFEMARRGRKREMSELIDELLTEWIAKQS